MNPPLLSSQALHITMGERVLCRDLNLQIHAGECWGIIGQNGAGKTTLLHTLAGLHKNNSGKVYLAANDIQTLSRRHIARHLGLMPQDTPDPFPATVLETALIGRHPYLSRWQWESKQDISFTLSTLDQVGLAEFEQRRITTLSGGERRRLALATLLVQNPALFMLDEPTNHLDLKFQQRVLQLIREKSRDTHAALMVLHDINHVVQYCDHVLMIFNNGETCHGKTSDILDSAVLSRLYDYPIEEHQTETGCWYMSKQG